MTFQKGTVRREEIVRTAKELFLERGLRDTSVNDIVGRLGIAKGTFYHYFSSKDELIELFIQEMIDGHLSEINNIIADSSRSFSARLRLCLEKFFHMATSQPAIQELNFAHPELLRQDLIEEFVLRACALLADFLEEGVASGCVGSKHSRIGCYIISLGIQSLWQQRASHGELPGEENFEELLAVIEDLLRMEGGSLTRPAQSALANL